VHAEAEAQGTQSQAAAGWYPDPWQTAPSRWWDGANWTPYTAGSFTVTTVAPAPPAPQARDDLRGGWIAILGFFGAIAISLLFARAAMATGADVASLPVVVAGQAGLWAGFVMAGFIVTHRHNGRGFGDLGLHLPTGKEFGLGVGIALLGLWSASRVMSILQAIFPDHAEGVGSNLFPDSRPSYTFVVVTAALACVGAPLFEELFFRGIVQTVLARHLGVTPAIVVQALLFGIAHFQLGMTMEYAIVRIGAITVVGLFLGWLRAHTGRLGAGIVAHATNNVIVVGLTLLAVTQ
jgi:membrane protease YdiL (CAAX protease family)